MADHFLDATKKADYISREAALELIDNAPIIAGNENETLISAPKLSDKVYCLPAADVVEVVRCKDCINWNGNDCITMHGLSAPRPDDYCSRGEKNSG